MLSTNHQRPIAFCYLANLTVALMAALWLIPTYGAIGAAIAGLTADVMIGLGVLPLVAARFLGLSMLQVYRELGLSLLVLLPVTVGVILLGPFLSSWGTAVLIISFGLIPVLAPRLLASSDWVMWGRGRNLSDGVRDRVS